MKEKREDIWNRVLAAFNECQKKDGKPLFTLVKLKDLRRRILKTGQDAPDAAR